MKRRFLGGLRLPILMALVILLLGLSVLVLFRWSASRPWLMSLTMKSRQLLGLSRGPTPDEKRIREEVILKKMEEGNLSIDWRHMAPEYPKVRDLSRLPEKERVQAFQNTPEFKEMDQAVKAFGKKKEDLMKMDPPLPSLRSTMDFTQHKDKGTDRVVRRLVNSKEKEDPLKPLEENLRLGIKGPVASRRIIERPALPSVRVTVETEIELTFWVLPDGRIDRVFPSVRGGAELERMGVQYLKRWRFAPLPEDEPQLEQWGTLPIKFKLSGKNP